MVKVTFLAIALTLLFLLACGTPASSLLSEEGLHKPTMENHQLFTLHIERAFSAVRVGNGSGVAICENLVLTNRHVNRCPCPEEGEILSCLELAEVDLVVKSPREIDGNGDVVSWLYGTVQAATSCGKQPTARDSNLAGADFAVLQVMWHTHAPPSVPLANIRPQLGDSVFVAGFPNFTYRSPINRKAVTEVMKSAIRQSEEIIAAFSASTSFVQGLEEAASLEVQRKTDFRASPEARACLQIESTYAPHCTLIYETVLEKFNNWQRVQEASPEAFSLILDCPERSGDYLERCLIDALAVLVLAALDHTKESLALALSTPYATTSFFDADASLRIALGHVIGFKDALRQGDQMVIRVTADGTDGNSGSGVFNSRGELIGLCYGGAKNSAVSYPEYISVIDLRAVGELIE